MKNVEQDQRVQNMQSDLRVTVSTYLFLTMKELSLHDAADLYLRSFKKCLLFAWCDS